ncbi:MAG: hypothetical protein JXB30_14520 [Anaerolineae bacterium]|nr:hypothetical protein [Anaerolineae bacterium]
MAKNQTKRLRPIQLQADYEAVIAAQSFGDYWPANPDYSTERLDELLEAMQATQEAEVNAANALSAARDAAVAAEWALHNAVLGLKEQVIAQYGSDSDQVQALGLKKKSERKRPTTRRAKDG